MARLTLNFAEYQYAALRRVICFKVPLIQSHLASTEPFSKFLKNTLDIAKYDIHFVFAHRPQNHDDNQDHRNLYLM